ncbi:hypothetical protein NESM_000271700 [Novymonas esmeraldas]|uniref:Uncharacterized protein n=1 Tax=Novymonas esmeraldas TaxID=1808958 RepID=A0AAW0F6Y0_9TRYP
MSGMDDRARQFKTAAESHLTGPALRKEVNTLRRFLFRNQEYRFTKAAQQALYMAVIAHHGNAAAHHASGYAVTSTAPSTAATGSSARATPGSSPSTTRAAAAAGDGDGDDEDGGTGADAADAPILRLLDDALKMPFTVFTSPQKDKLLSLYWAVLGTDTAAGTHAGNASPATTVPRTLSLMDIVVAGKGKALLSLFTDAGEEYPQEVLVTDAGVLKRLEEELNKGVSVSVTVQESETGATFVSYAVDDDDANVKDA